MSARRSALVLALAMTSAAALAATAGAQVLEGPPSVTIDAPADGSAVHGTVNVTGNASDGGLDGSVEEVEVRIDDGPWREANGTEPFHLRWNTKLWDSGNHTVTARATDDDGNTENDTVDVTVDQAATVDFVHPRQNLTVADGVDIQGTAEDPEGNVTGVEVRIDDGPWTEANGTDEWTLAWNTSHVDDGEHTVFARANDAGPATNPITAVNVTVSNEAENPPSVSIEEPEQGQTVGGAVEVTGTAHDPEGNLTAVQVRIDGGSWESVDGLEEWSYRWDAGTYADGEHVIAARADDGNTSTVENVTVAVDNGGQTPVEIERPEDGADVEGTVTVAGTVQASEGSIETVEVSVDGGPWIEADSSRNWSYSWDTGSLPAGSHRVSVRAQTAQGPTAPASITVHVTQDTLEPTAEDGQAPELALETRDGETVSGEFTLSGAVHDADDETATLEYRIDGGSWQTVTVSTGEAFDEQVDVSDLEPGEHTVTVRATDGERTSDEESFTVQVEDEGVLGAPGPGAMLLAVAVAAAGLLARRPRSDA